MNYLVVGCGFFGATIAERIATVLHKPVRIIERRSHVGGNCYSQVDEATGIECHRYGSHIFHTSNPYVWAYISRFTSFTSYQHKVLIEHAGKTYSMPINLGTINAYYQCNLKPFEVANFLQAERHNAGISEPKNLEEKAISLIGRPLYEAFIKGYTQKQWECDPRDLPAEIITRLPVRHNYNTNYFSDPWQGIPQHGYTAVFNAMLNNPLITVELNTDFAMVRENLPSPCTVIYTGMLDAYFDCCHGALQWRSLDFEWETVPVQDYQGTSVMNYADTTVPFTRIHEFKQYHPERTQPFLAPHTVICREYAKAFTPECEAYYPVNNAPNNALYARYLAMAEQQPHLVPGGRLGCYQYWDMDKTIANALEVFETRIAPYFLQNSGTTSTKMA